MKPTCQSGFDVDHIARFRAEQRGKGGRRYVASPDLEAFEGHFETCDVCQGRSRILERATLTWKAAGARDALLRPVKLSVEDGKSPSIRTAPALGISLRARNARVLGALALAAAMAMLVAGAATRRTPPQAKSTPGHAPAETHESVPALKAPVPESVAEQAKEEPSPETVGTQERATTNTRRMDLRVVAVDNAANNHRAALGQVIAPGESMTLKRGGRLVLAWSFALEPGPHSDAGRSTVELTGPSAFESTPDGKLALQSGAAKVRAKGACVVETPLMRVSGENATWFVYSERDRTRVRVILGTIVVEGTSGGARKVLGAGEKFEIARRTSKAALDKEASKAPGVAALPNESPKPNLAGEAPVWKNDAASPASPASPETHRWDERGAWASIERLLEKGERKAALDETEEFLRKSQNPALRSRAEITLGTLLLARGESTRAQRVLAAHTTSPNAALAFEAAVLLARSQPAAQDRTTTWQRYLGVSRGSPFRERGSVELVRALLDAGDKARAQSEFARISTSTVDDVTREEMKKVEQRLGTGR